MVDLQAMQNEFLDSVKALQRKYGVTSMNSVGVPANLSADDKYHYQLEFDDLYGRSYEDRINALKVDKGLSSGGNLDPQMVLMLSDQAKASFGVAANASAPIPTTTTFGAWWDNSWGAATGPNSPLSATTTGDFWARTAAGIAGLASDVTGLSTDTLAAEAQNTSNALGFLVAAVVVFFIVEKF